MLIIRTLILLLLLSSCKNNIQYNGCYHNCYELLKEKKDVKLGQDGEIVGFIYDFVDDSVLEFGEIEVYNTNFRKKLETNQNGKFKILLEEGEYFIKITTFGKNTLLTEAIPIKKGYRKILKFKVTYEL